MRAEQERLDWERGESGMYAEAQVFAALDAYRSKRARETAMGPALSFAFHALLLALLSIFVVATDREVRHAVEITRRVPEEPVEPTPPEPPEPLQTEDPQVSPVVTPEIPKPVARKMVSSDEATPDDEIETDDDIDLQEVLDVLNNPTQYKLPTFYGGRTPKGRKEALTIGRGIPAGQNSVLKALRWLASVQRDDGSWEGLPAQSGLALLCFLAHGDTPLSEEFGGTVQRGIQWLATNMPDGRAWGDGDGHVAYAHGIATYALAEAYGMTQIPFLAGPVESGISIIVNGQQANGGFDYNYKKGARWDLSVTGWQMQAMKAAYIAGCTNPKLPSAIKRAVSFTKEVAYAQKGGDAISGSFGYTQAGKESGSSSMTGIGTVGLQLLGAGASAQAHAGARFIAARKAATWALAKQNWSAIASKHLYGWYYDTQAMFQHFKETDPEWRRWNQSFQHVLIRNQHNDGYWTHAEHQRMGGDAIAGKVLSTTFCCLQLEVYYRHLKTYAFSVDRVAKAPIGLGEGSGGLIIR